MNTIKKISVMLLACLLSLTLFSCTNSPETYNPEKEKQQLFEAAFKDITGKLGFEIGDYNMYNAVENEDDEIVKDTSQGEDPVGTLKITADNVTYSVGLDTGVEDFDLRALASTSLKSATSAVGSSNSVSFEMIDNTTYYIYRYNNVGVFQMSSISGRLYYIFEKASAATN